MHSIMEFQIPLSREDLLQPSGGSQFFVSELLPAREIVSRLEGRPSNACPPSLPLHTLTSLIPFLLCLCVDCLIMHTSGNNILSRMQVTAGLRCHSLHSRVFPCLLQSSTVSLHTAYCTRHTHLVSWIKTCLPNQPSQYSPVSPTTVVQG